MKNKLVKDKELMIAGSDAYINRTDVDDDIISTNYIVDFNTPVINYNVDYVKYGSPFFVRESGIYIMFFIATVDTACQFSIFVNGEFQPLTCIGINAGAGQLVSRHMVKLNENDNILVRNYISTSNSVTAHLYAGGLQLGNTTSFLMMKIAPLCPPRECHEQIKCLSHRKKKLFHKLTEKLECDKELMAKGFNVTGTFSNTVSQTVATEGDVIFASSNEVQGLSWSGSQITIQEDGVYKLFFLLTSQTAVQFSMTVNGAPVETTTQGTNRGAGQLTSRAILELKKNDVVTLRNHTSQNGAAVLSEHAGGLNATISAILTIFKIAQLCKPVCVPVPCWVEKKLECMKLYDMYKNYLLCQDHLQIAGPKSYFSLTDSLVQNVIQNEAFYWSTNNIKYETQFRPGDTFLTIEKNGVYDIFVDIATDEPVQLGLFVNGVLEPSTNFGRDSGASRTLMRQFIKLKKCDVIAVHNAVSGATSVNTSQNGGGNGIGQNAMFMAFLLHPTC